MAKSEEPIVRTTEGGVKKGETPVKRIEMPAKMKGVPATTVMMLIARVMLIMGRVMVKVTTPTPLKNVRIENESVSPYWTLAVTITALIII